jgi:phosphoribosylformylglycinamidine synthase
LSHLAEVKKRFEQARTPCAVLGSSTVKKAVTIQYNGELAMDDSMVLLRQWWEETSYQLERLQTPRVKVSGRL